MDYHPARTSESDDTLQDHETQSTTKGGEDNVDMPQKMTFTRFMAIIALAACYTGSQIHSWFTGAALVFIADSLHIGSERSWIPVSGSLAAACIAPVAGYLQDFLGRRASLLVGLVLVMVGSIVLATAENFPAAVAGSVISGIGSAIEELTATAAISELVPAKKRGLFLAFNTALAILFTPAILYSQLLSNYVTWRWLFWISLMWNGLTTVGIFLTYFRMHIDRQSRPADKVTLKQIDFVGFVLLIVGVTLFLVALQAGGQSEPWDSAYIISLLVVGVVCIIALLGWEYLEIGRPLIPYRIFRGQRVVGFAFIIGVFSSILSFAILTLGPEIIQACFQFSPAGYGVIALGPSLALAVGATTSNVLFTLTNGRAREILTVSAVLMTAFSGAQATINPTNSTQYAVLGSFAALGIGGTLIPITTLVTLACPQDLIGTAVALVHCIRTIAGTVGYAILYNIFLSKSRAELSTEMAPRLIKAGLPRNETQQFIEEYALALSSGGTAPRANATILAAAREGFAWSTSDGASLVYYVTIPFGVLTIIFSVFLPDIRKYMTNKVLSPSAKKAN